MALSTDDLAWLRSEISDVTPPEDGDLSNSYDRLGSLEAVAAEVIRKRLATMLANPAQFAVEGYEENNGVNIGALTKQLARLEASIPLDGEDGAGVGAEQTVQLVRIGWER